MAKINAPSIVNRIDAVELTQTRRPHLGGSQIGHKCKRYLWYSFHWAADNSINTKSNRIFRLGDAIEDLIVADLSRVALTVTNSQLRVTGYKQHAGGSIDGIVGDSLFEAKSMNMANYAKLVKLGVEEAFPIYYSQVQYYMGRLNLDTTLFVAMNKNTQEMHTESIIFDIDHFEELKEIEKSIIEAKSPDAFVRIGSHAGWFECKFCSAKDVCHSSYPMEKNCRTCTNSQIKSNGRWWCTERAKHLDFDEQIAACSVHDLIKG